MSMTADGPHESRDNLTNEGTPAQRETPADETAAPAGTLSSRAEARVALAEARAERAEARVERAELELSRAKSLDRSSGHRFALAQTALNGFRVALWIAVSVIPIQALQLIAEDFAGQDTQFNANMEISLAYSGAVTVALMASLVLGRLRKKKLIRLRERVTELETVALQQLPQRGGT